jgi:hypothetical protein
MTIKTSAYPYMERFAALGNTVSIAPSDLVALR